MQTIRRLYLYAITLISLEVILWGSIGLLRSALSRGEVGNSGASQLAGALALILVGIPVFLVHWRLAQSSALREPEERLSRVRVVFLYLTLLVTLIPIAQNTLNLIDQLLLRALGLDPLLGFLGSEQSPLDNLVAIVANAVAAAYFYRALMLDRRSTPGSQTHAEVRRIYNYIWLIYSLTLVFAGLQQIIQFVIYTLGSVGVGIQGLLPNGLALLIVGLPIWIFVERLIRQTLVDPMERDSLTRLVVLYGLVFIGMVGMLAAGGLLLYQIFRIVLGPGFEFARLGREIANPLSIILPLALVWTYYGRTLSQELTESSDEQPEEPTSPSEPRVKIDQRRTSLRYLYYYTLAFLGLAATIIGLLLLLQAILDLALGTTVLGTPALRDQVAAALATLLVGLPVWIFTWRPMAAEGAREGEAGDLARRSAIRRTYLYLLLFSGVIGMMVSAGTLIYQILRSLLGDPPANLLLTVLQEMKNLLIFFGLFIYHGLVLRNDGNLAQRALTRLHAQYPVLIIASSEDKLAADLIDTLQRQIPGLPVAFHLASQGAPDVNLSTARAVILSAEMAARPSEAIRIWLQGFDGQRLVLPTPLAGWSWVGSSHSAGTLTRKATQIVRQLAEGQEAGQERDTSAFMVLVYILAGLFTLELALLALALIISLIQG